MGSVSFVYSLEEFLARVALKSVLCGNPGSRSIFSIAYVSCLFFLLWCTLTVR